MPSTEKHVAAGSLALHLDAPVRGAWHRYRRRFVWPSSGHASGQQLYLVLQSPFQPPRGHGRSHCSQNHSSLQGTANVLINKYIPLWGYPRRLLSGHGLQETSRSFRKLYTCKLLGVRKVATSSYHPNCNDSVERAIHTMAEVMVMVANERQDDGGCAATSRWIRVLHNNSVIATTVLAPIEFLVGRPH